MRRNRRKENGREKKSKREKGREKQVADDVMRNRRAVGKERANSGKTDAPQIRPRISELEAPESSVAAAVEIKSSGSSGMCVRMYVCIEGGETVRRRERRTGSVCTGRTTDRVRKRAVLYSG